MVGIRNSSEIKKMRKAGLINFQTHKLLESKIRPGITTLELNDIAEEFIKSKGGIPSFKGYGGFPKTICTSVNDEVVHGIPSLKKLKKGDIISIDIGVIYQGYHSDSAATYPVGEISDENKMLLEETKNALFAGLSKVKNGAHLGDVSAAIEKHAKKYKLGVVRELVGHGVGKNLHEDPDIPNFGKENTGLLLKSGMTLAIEPMLNLGTRKVWMEDDDWTIVTQDGKPSAHFEHTILVTDDGYEILTGE